MVRVMWCKLDVDLTKGKEGVKFWFNAESFTKVTAHRISAQHLRSQEKENKLCLYKQIGGLIIEIVAILRSWLFFVVFFVLFFFWFLFLIK